MVNRYQLAIPRNKQYMSNYTSALTFVLCLILCSCGRKHPGGDNVPQRGTPAITNVNSRVHAITNTAKVIARAGATATSPMDRCAVDNVVKAMSAFDTALGLQCVTVAGAAQQSLLQYTNALAALTNKEFAEFLRKYLNAHPLTSDVVEIRILRDMALQRLTTNTMRTAFDTYSDILFNLAPYYLRDRDNDSALAMAHTVFNDYNAIAGQLTCEQASAIAMQLAGLSVVAYDVSDRGDAERTRAFCRFLEDQANNNAITAEARCQIEAIAAWTLVRVDFDECMQRLRTIANAWPDDKRGMRYRALQWHIEGAASGLRGRELSQYVLDKVTGRR